MPNPQIRSKCKIFKITYKDKRALSGYVIIILCIMLAYLGILQQRYWHKQMEYVAQKSALETQRHFAKSINDHLHSSDSVMEHQLLLSWKEADVMLVEIAGVKSLRIRPHP